MNKKALKALKESIAHWQRLADGVKGEQIGPGFCALCGLFNTDTSGAFPDPNCSGCPVYEHTGRKYCGVTPYYAAELFAEFDGTDHSNFIEAALEERDFLISLLPEGETP